MSADCGIISSTLSKENGMKITTVLFDLDGTLLPMDQDDFVNAYFGLLSRRMAGFGFEPKELIGTIWAGTKNMMKNDNSRLNEEVFWEEFRRVYGEKGISSQPQFDEFYYSEFLKVKDICGFNPLAAETVYKIKAAGLRVALATQPIFPSIATEHRTRWAGLDVSDFEIFTAFDNIGSCKPNLIYYEEVCRRMGVTPQECLMVGNDVDDDMVAENLGMQTFLLTDCLINQSGKDISKYNRGTFEDLQKFLNI